MYYETLFKKNKNNLRKSWQVIKDIIGKHKHGPIMSKRFKVNSTEIGDPLIISNRFNEYFVNIGNNFANKIKMQPNSYEKYLGGTFQESMFLSPVSKGDMNSIISTFGDTASWWDDIAPRSIKFVKEIIQKPLMHICNLSFYTGIVPEQIKMDDAMYPGTGHAVGCWPLCTRAPGPVHSLSQQRCEINQF